MKHKPSSARKFYPGVQMQLLLFISGVTLLTLGLLWALIIYGLQPSYNQNIREDLQRRTDSIVEMIDASDEPIAERSFGTLTLNDDFWAQLRDAISDGTIDVDNCCVDISDSTCRNIQYYETLYPCVLHETMAAFGAVRQFTKDTVTVIELRKQLFEEKSLYTIVDNGSTRQMVVGKVSADGQFGVIVSANLAQIEMAAGVLADLLPPIALLLLLLDILFAAVFSRWFTRPLLRLTDGAHQIAEGNYDVQVKVSHRDEVGLLAQEFNHMAEEVKRSTQLEKDILANVSHDLRTPLTLIKGYAETVRDISGEDAERRSEQCNIIVDETDRLSALVNSVMELSKVQSGAQQPNLVEFDMSDLCFEVAGRYDAVCEQNGWTLKLEADKQCPVRADPDMMERVLHNLLGNATHHIGEDKEFVLRCIPLEKGCRVEVEDHGPGIPPEDLPYIFDRYYRSRSDAGKAGTGLGLSITKAILQLHGFAFGVDSTVGTGSIFWFVMQDTRENGAALPEHKK